jgi:hypothetical protein
METQLSQERKEGTIRGGWEPVEEVTAHNFPELT